MLSIINYIIEFAYKKMVFKLDFNSLILIVLVDINCPME